MWLALSGGAVAVAFLPSLAVGTPTSKYGLWCQWLLLVPLAIIAVCITLMLRLMENGGSSDKEAYWIGQEVGDTEKTLRIRTFLSETVFALLVVVLCE